MLEEIQEAAEVTTPDKIKKKWRAKVENKTLVEQDLLSYFQLSAPYFLTCSKKDNVTEIGESCGYFCECFASPRIVKMKKSVFLKTRQRESHRSLHLSHSPFQFRMCIMTMARGLRLSHRPSIQ